MIGDILQPTHLLFVLVIALLVLGPKRLPEVGRSLGRGIRDFRNAIGGEDGERGDGFLGSLTQQRQTVAPQPVAPQPEAPPTPAAAVATQPVAPHAPVTVPASEPAASEPVASEAVASGSGEPTA